MTSKGWITSTLIVNQHNEYHQAFWHHSHVLYLFGVKQHQNITLSKVIGSISAVATPIHVFGVCYLPESSSLIGQFTGSVHYLYVTDDGRSSNLQKWFSNKKRKLLVLVGLMTNHDHFFSQYFLSAALFSVWSPEHLFVAQSLI